MSVWRVWAKTSVIEDLTHGDTDGLQGGLMVNRKVLGPVTSAKNGCLTAVFCLKAKTERRAVDKAHEYLDYAFQHSGFMDSSYLAEVRVEAEEDSLAGSYYEHYLEGRIDQLGPEIDRLAADVRDLTAQLAGARSAADAWRRELEALDGVAETAQWAADALLKAFGPMVAGEADGRPTALTISSPTMSVTLPWCRYCGRFEREHHEADGALFCVSDAEDQEYGERNFGLSHPRAWDTFAPATEV